MNWYKLYKVSRDLYNVSNPIFDFQYYGVQNDPYKKRPFGIGTGNGFDLKKAPEMAGAYEGPIADYTKKYNPGQVSERADDTDLMIDRPTDHDGEDGDNNDMLRPFEGPSAFYSEDSPLSRGQQISQKIHDNMKGVHNMGINIPPIYSKIRHIYQGF